MQKMTTLSNLLLNSLISRTLSETQKAITKKKVRAGNKDHHCLGLESGLKGMKKKKRKRMRLRSKAKIGKAVILLIQSICQGH